MRHVNAWDVLPENLLRKVQKYCSGYIYVPSTRQFYWDGRREVLRLGRRGFSAMGIAERVHVGERRVRQILAEGEGRK